MTQPAGISGTTIHDAVIIGAGPVGLFAVFQLGQLDLGAAVVDVLETPGGQCAALYPEKPLYDIPAISRISGRELAESLVAQAGPFGPLYCLGRAAVSLVRREDGLFVTGLGNGESLLSRTVVVAAGGGMFRPRRPPLAGIEALEGHAVHYSVTDRGRFAGERLVIAGGGDSAVDWAVDLAGIAGHVFMVHRRGSFRAAPGMVRRLGVLGQEGKVEMVVPFQLSQLVAEGRTLRAVIVSGLDGSERSLDARHLLAFFGLETTTGSLASWFGAGEFRDGCIQVKPESMETQTPGLFAIGDIASYPGKLKLILTGFAEAALAAHGVRAHIWPERSFHFVYSTTKGPPGGKP